MALSDIRRFLNDLLLRFDPSLDTSDGSRTATEVIDPIIARIGCDPFDDDIEVFIRTRLAQQFPELAITEADELTDLLIDPMRVLLEPITREIQLVKLRTSISNVNALGDDEVDALMGNFFESRRVGGYALGVVRFYFAAPQGVSVTLINIAQSRGGLRYLVPRPQAITAEQMLLNVDGSEYYFDTNYVAEMRGSEYNIERGEIITVANLPGAIRVTNLRRFTEGVARETSNDFVARVQQGTSDKTLTTAPGIIGVLTDNFPSLRQVFEIGFGDPEMQRDVLSGGGLGAVPEDDSLGKYYGYGTPIDDLDADGTTNLLEAEGGDFVTRVGSVGQVPQGWGVTLVYSDQGELTVRDATVREVVTNTRLRVDQELPLSLPPGGVTWMLRENRLTISGIAGGVALPDTPHGAITVPSGAVHIGGKTDIFVAAAAEPATARVAGLTDEKPLARGFHAQTQGGAPATADLVILRDIEPDNFSRVSPGMSLVLAGGTDVGAYRVLEVRSDQCVRVDTPLTGAQSDLVWKIVDEINLDLISPKDILLEGADLNLSAGSDQVNTASGANFSGAGVRAGDVLYVDDPVYGGDYAILEATTTSLRIDPVGPRALNGVHYVVSRRTEGVQLPLLRVQGLELLDSAGAPNGTRIPYRDPVLCVSRAFQNESTGLLYEGEVIAGLVSAPLSGVYDLEYRTLEWAVYDPARNYQYPLAQYTFRFGVPADAAGLAAQINADLYFTAQNVRAVVLARQGKTYLGLTSPKRLCVLGGTAPMYLGIAPGATNVVIRTTAGFSRLKIRPGDLITFAGGNNNGQAARLVATAQVGADSVGTLGTGPLGPPGTESLYDLLPLSPDVGGRVKIARPSVGSVRVYFLEPTSVDFPYATTRFRTSVGGQERIYQPDPENTRTIIPPPPQTTIQNLGTVNAAPGAFEDLATNFQVLGIQQGDLLDLEYVPLDSTTTVASTATAAVGGTTLALVIGDAPVVQVSFPYAMQLDAVASYINEQAGVAVASVRSDRLRLALDRSIEIVEPSTVLGVLAFTGRTNLHPQHGTYVVQSVAPHQLVVADATRFTAAVVPETYYRVRRYLQRVSSTEMNLQVDASGLYYADVEAIAVLPGDYNNIGSDVELEVTGYRSDGYRLRTRYPELSYSRAEELSAEISRTLLLVGASDNPADFVQLNLQNLQVTYERSGIVDEVQSFCSSRYRRVVCQDILVRHLLPHYVTLNWRYDGGVTEAEMRRALVDYLAGLEGGAELEVGKLRDVLVGKQATSVFAADPASPSGRSAPLVLVVAHGETRGIKASLVRDVVDTVRMSTYFADTLTLRRLSGSGIR